mgnify:FL=1
MERYYFFILFGYLSGSILFARLLPKYLRHIDICELSEDNNPGVFNAFKHAGPVIGSMTLLLELAKGFLPVHVGLQLLDPRNTLFALVLAAPVFGHAFPLFRPKEGGKSIAVSFGCLLGLFPDLAPVCTLAAFYLLFSAVVIIEPHLVRSIVTYLCFSLMTFRYSAPRPVILGALVISGIVIFKHLVKFEKEPVSIRLIRRNR